MNRPTGRMGSMRRMGRNKAFLLLETMFGVAIFAMGVLVLAKCMDHCFDAEAVRVQDQLARTALQNQMAAIEGGAVVVGDKESTEELQGRFTGITLKTSRTALEWKNEKDEELSGLYEVSIAAHWRAPQGEQSKSLSFYVISEQ